jgi:hypothetical protein
MTDNGHDPCPSCRGRGWKFKTMRRSPDNGGGTAETALLERPREPCIFCRRTGQAGQ